MKRKPDWLKISLKSDERYIETKNLTAGKGLHTICESGKCPNISECRRCGTATFMILGDICTRACKFCATKSGKPLPVNRAEANQIAESIRSISLKYAVITSVDRDDLPDKGAEHWRLVVECIRNINPDTAIEVLIPDFDGDKTLLDLALLSKPNVVGHNIETVERLTPSIRSKARYNVSMNVLHHISSQGFMTKSGVMVGLGETENEVIQTMRDAYNNGVRLFTIGQYLQPTTKNVEVAEYITPEQFDIYKRIGKEIGFQHIESAPLVRSSYMAHRGMEH